MTRVLLVDDHRVVRGGLRTVLDAEDDLDVVGEADSVAGGRSTLGALRPDVAVVDVTLGDGSGLDLVREARAAYPGMGLVVLTMHGDDDTLFAALEAGASSLVLKTAHLEVVLDAVRRAAVAPDTFSAAGLGAAMRRRSADPRPVLTPREKEVLVLLTEGLSVGMVARRLFLSESTVKTHIARLYGKLGAGNRAQAVTAAIRMRLVTAGG